LFLNLAQNVRAKTVKGGFNMKKELKLKFSNYRNNSKQSHDTSGVKEAILNLY